MLAPADFKRTKIVGNIATLFSGSVVSQVMTALALLFTARQLNANGYGQYAACIAIASLSSIGFSLGMDIWLLREGGRATHGLGELVGSVLGIKGMIGIVWMLLFSLLAPLLNQDTYPTTLLKWSVLLIWLDTLIATTLTGFKAALENKVPAILEASADFVWFALTLLLIFVGVKQPEIYIQLRVLVSSLALFTALLFLKRFVGVHFNIEVVRIALKKAFPYATSEFLGMVTLRADLVILGLTLGEYATGVYSPAVGLINMALLVPMTVYMVMVPVLGNLYRNHPVQAKKSSIRTIGLLIVIGIGLMLLFFVGSPLIVIILGPTYQASLSVLRILSFVLLFKCVSFSMAAIIVATDKQGTRTVAQTIAAAANIGLNLAVVYRLGVNGVAGVYVITEIILLIGYTWIVWKKR